MAIPTLSDLRLPQTFDLTSENPLGDFHIYRGDEYPLTLFVEFCGTRISLADYTSGITQIRDSLDGNVLATGTVTIEDNGETGRIDIHYPTTETDALPAVGVWDVRLIKSNGNRTTVFRGAIETERDVSSP